MHAAEDDFHVGRSVLERKLVSREALLETLFALAEERRMGRPRPLGIMLVSRGLLAEKELDGIMAARVAGEGGGPALRDADLGRLLVATERVTPENVEECLGLQESIRRSGGAAPALGEILISRGYVTQAQLERVLAYQRKTTYACSRCGLKATLAPPPAGQQYQCEKCGEALVPLQSPGADAGGLGLKEAAHEEDSQLEIDRAVVSYLKQKNMVRRNLLREAQRLQLEFARYGLIVQLLELVERLGAISGADRKALEKVDFAAVVHDPDWKQQTVPGYRLVRRMATGGFAAIWLAESVFGQTRTAVKILHPERARDPRAVARFEWEAGLLRRFNSPHIVRGLDQGFERGNHYLIMEYVPGRSLGQVLYESGSFPVREALQATRQAAEALRYLHGQGFLHRDIKPDNALIDDAGLLKLCDLGFSIPIPKVEGTSAAVAGTPGYIAPEVGKGGPLATVGADLYSLGILLYALLTGDEPFAGASSEEVVAEQVETGLPVPNLMLVNAPAEVVQLLKRMMHPDPARRIASAADAVTAIDKLARP